MPSSIFDFLIPAAQAQGTAGGGEQNPLLGFALPIVLLVVFYFLLIRPQMKRSKEQRQMLEKLAKGDEAITSGGLAGRISAIGEAYVTLEIADNVEVKVQKNAIVGVLPKGSLKNL